MSEGIKITKDQIIEHLKKRIFYETRSCNNYSKSDDRALCLLKYVGPLENMITYLESVECIEIDKVEDKE